jgi:hypothetical protein
MAFADLVAQTDRAVQGLLGSATVTYAPAEGDPVEVIGMFDENYILVLPENAGVESAGPSVFLRLEDLPVHPDDDDPVLTIAGVDYTIRERQTDGSAGGGIRLLLHKVP